jgi:hypothetical protein
VPLGRVLAVTVIAGLSAVGCAARQPESAAATRSTSAAQQATFDVDAANGIEWQLVNFGHGHRDNVVAFARTGGYLLQVGGTEDAVSLLLNAVEVSER